MPFLAGDDLTAAQLEKIANVPRARIMATAVQTIPNNAFTALTFDLEDFKVNMEHLASGDQTYLGCLVAGLYLFTGGCYFDSNGTGVRGLKWQKNGVDVPASGSTILAVSAGWQPGPVARPVYLDLAVGDKVTLLAVQNAGGTLNTYVTADYTRANMAAVLVRDNSL